MRVVSTISSTSLATRSLLHGDAARTLAIRKQVLGLVDGMKADDDRANQRDNNPPRARNLLRA
jgi:hypothetical protein